MMRRLLALAILAAPLATPQSLDTGIVGTVTDPGGAVITGASVTMDGGLTPLVV